MKGNSSRESLILYNYQAPGDLLMLSAVLRDLHLTYPNQYITDVKCSCPEIFMHNPYISPVIERCADYRIDMKYPLCETMESSQDCSLHFVHAFRKYLEEQLGIRINPHGLKGEIYLTDNEKKPIIDEKYYWILNTGWKDDFTVKRWSPEKFRTVAQSFPDITFVQTGSKKHSHPIIDEPNVINMVGKTSIRKFLRLVYHSSGILTGVSFPMHACAAVPVPKDRKYKVRPCIVVAGGRECPVWEQYNNHTFISRVGMLDCCLNGGCNKRRVIPVNDGKKIDSSLCKYPVKEDIQYSACMQDIDPFEIINPMGRYITCQKSL